MAFALYFSHHLQMELVMADIQSTPLLALHQELGAKMVAFAGYQMPIHYPAGIFKEHQHTRNQAGLFDISHMGQIQLSGRQVATALEHLVPSNIRDLAIGRQRYTVLTNETGGIRDDLMISRVGDDWWLVVNAACKYDDFNYLSEQLSTDCKPVLRDDRALLALQGPAAASVLHPLVQSGNLDIPFMSVTEVQIGGIDCLAARSGYTGEDGYELSVSNDQVETLARLLLAQEAVQPVGLGARDSLRLEAGLCLYGHDIDTDTNLIEAGLAWVIDKAYKNNEGRVAQFPGATETLDAFTQGCNRRRVGIRPLGRAPVREGAILTNSAGLTVGQVTSGGFGPSFGGPVAMGYISLNCSQPNTQLNAEVRGRAVPVQVVRLPFIPHRYHQTVTGV